MQTHCFCNINFLWHFQANAYIINFISHRRSLSLPFPSSSIILIPGSGRDLQGRRGCLMKGKQGR